MIDTCIYYREPCSCINPCESHCGNRRDDVCTTKGDIRAKNKTNGRWKDGENQDYNSAVDKLTRL